jgi:hypothetical protein
VHEGDILAVGRQLLQAWDGAFAIAGQVLKSERRVRTRSPCADTDVANVPMIASFEWAEWARFATRREYGVGLHWFLTSSPRSEATGELYDPARLVRSSALASASGRRSPPSTSKTSTDSSPASRALWASWWVISW